MKCSTKKPGTSSHSSDSDSTFFGSATDSDTDFELDSSNLLVQEGFLKNGKGDKKVFDAEKLVGIVPKRSRKKKRWEMRSNAKGDSGSGGGVVVFLVVVLLLAGGGVAAWYFLIGPGKTATTASSASATATSSSSSTSTSSVQSTEASTPTSSTGASADTASPTLNSDSGPTSTPATDSDSRPTIYGTGDTTIILTPYATCSFSLCADAIPTTVPSGNFSITGIDWVSAIDGESSTSSSSCETTCGTYGNLDLGCSALVSNDDFTAPAYISCLCGDDLWNAWKTCETCLNDDINSRIQAIISNHDTNCGSSNATTGATTST